MYQSPKFKAKNQQEVLDLMHQNPFVTLIGHNGEFPVATQLPVQIDTDADGRLVLSGHMMKHSDHYQAFLIYPNVLALFTGPHTYVSASVYKDPAAASTWNYMTVHAKGKIQILDEQATYEAIKRLTNQHEDPQTSPAAFHKMTDSYIQKNLQGIAAFEIEVEQLDHVFKLSQNHKKENQEAIIEDLKQRDNPDSAQIAQAMEGI
ncbi:MAG: FMN-binding negative transcriptional regulator [Bacteroidota bacterium]